MTDQDERHAATWDHARRVATRILAEPWPLATESARYIARVSARIVGAHSDCHRAPPPSPAVEALDLIGEAWPRLRRGACSGEELFAGCPGLWNRLMNEWPMGEYAELAATAFEAGWGGGGVVVELGAGVGATTRRLRRTLAATVIATDLDYPGPRAVDFDAPLAPLLPRADAVVATNALHCAADPAATLGRIHDLLKPGGRVVLAEGAAYPEPGVAWPLDLLFGACRGWYDRGGFRTPEFWLGALDAAGFAEIARLPCASERYELGGCFVGVRSS